MADAIQVPTWYYQHFDGDFSKPVPEDGFGGWKKAELELSLSHTAVVVMHSWDCGTYEQFPGWYRAVPYIPRSIEISRTVFPGLLAAVRKSPLKLFHVAASGDYYKKLPGYTSCVAAAGPPPSDDERVESDPVKDRLLAFKSANVHPGVHNQADIASGFARVDFTPESRPVEGEYIAESGHQLFAACKEHGVNHLIYAGFAIDGCLLMSPAGMIDMSQRGVMCSALRQATTAIEMKETAQGELAKEIALWRVALLFGFVYDVGDFVGAITSPLISLQRGT